jgi:hypothetical protein
MTKPLGASLDETHGQPSRQAALMPLLNMYNARNTKKKENTLFNFFTGSRCAALAPKGAVTTLKHAMTTMPGSQI